MEETGVTITPGLAAIHFPFVMSDIHITYNLMALLTAMLLEILDASIKTL